MKIKKDPHFVYLLKDGEIVVYVGCTKNLLTRLKKHKNKIHNNVEVVKFNFKIDALNNERRFLIKYMPKYNWIPPHICLAAAYKRVSQGRVTSERKYGKTLVKVK